MCRIERVATLGAGCGPISFKPSAKRGSHVRIDIEPTDGSGSGAGTGRQISASLAIVAVILVALGLRPSIVSIGPILPSIISEFRLSHATASLLTSIPDLLMGLFALPTPWLARRFGRDAVLLFALVLLSASTLGRAYTGTTFSLLASTAGVGIGIAMAGTLIAGFIKARFASQAAFLMGIYATALSVGSTVAAALTGPVATAAPGGWRLASGMWTSVIVIGAFAWAAVTLSERKRRAIVAAPSVVHSLPIRDGKAWLVALFFACVNLLFYSILAWTAAMYQEAGATTATAGLILATFMAVFTVANPIFGWLSRDEDRRGWLAVGAGLAMVGLVAIAIAPKAAPFLWISICAFGLAGTFTLGMTLPLDNTRSVSEANAWNAFVLMVGYIIASAGPLIIGEVRDASGNFGLAYWLLAAIATSMLMLTPFLKPRVHRVRE
jgi:MFS transporter, CP family, cyanate transporter